MAARHEEGRCKKKNNFCLCAADYRTMTSGRRGAPHRISQEIRRGEGAGLAKPADFVKETS